jgi:hypothetical protein
VQAASSSEEPWVAQMLEASGNLHASSLECKMTRQQLRLQVSQQAAYQSAQEAQASNQCLP